MNTHPLIEGHSAGLAPEVPQLPVSLLRLVLLLLPLLVGDGLGPLVLLLADHLRKVMSTPQPDEVSKYWRGKGLYQDGDIPRHGGIANKN